MANSVTKGKLTAILFMSLRPCFFFCISSCFTVLTLNSPANGEAAWERLVEGNKRFASGDMSSFLSHMALEISKDYRSTLVGRQVSC